MSKQIHFMRGIILCLSIFIQPVFATVNYNSTTQGQFSVGPRGAANYNIPVDVPEGINGLQPSISINYNSHGGNNILGMGWVLSGLSSITRCPKTFDQDGSVRSVSLDSGDVFCLDGKRLIVTNGMSYGSSGAEYATEVGGSQIITSHGSTGNGPSYFKVKNKSGTVIRYGYIYNAKAKVRIASGSRIGQEPVYRWAIDTVTDLSNNRMSFRYVNNTVNGSHRIDYIDYRHVNSIPTVRVDFIYAGETGSTQSALRTDIETKYVAGAKISTPYLLTNIRTRVNSIVSNELKIKFVKGVATSRSLIRSVTDCQTGDVNTTCKPPVNFSWGQGGNVLQVGQGTSTGFTDSGGWNSGQRYFQMDVNGDGRGDLVLRYGNGTFKTLLSNGARLVPGASTATGFTDSGGWNSGQRYFKMDVNGDGRGDLVLRYGNGTFKTLLSNGARLVPGESTATGFTDSGGWNSGQRYFQMDVNGDGRGDLVLRYGNGTFQTLLSNGTRLVLGESTPTGFSDRSGWNSGQRYFQMDVNGDGRGDLVLRYGNGTFKTLLSNGARLVPGESTSTGFTDSGGWNSGQRYFQMDINGDGRGDLVLRYGNGTFKTLLSNGARLVPGESTATGFRDSGGWNSGQRYFKSDVNGDGKTDLVLRYGNGTFKVLLSNGKRLVPAGATATGYSDSSGWNSGQRYFQMDVNGDGKGDLVLRYGNGTFKSILSAGSKTDLMSSIDNSYSNVAKIAYSTLSSGTAYTRSNSFQYPIRAMQNSLNVVNQASTSNGLDGVNVSNYHYYYAKTHTRGRGFLGFYKVLRKDLTTGIETHTMYHQQARTEDSYTLPVASRDFWKTGMVYYGYKLYQGKYINYDYNQWIAKASIKNTVLPYVKLSRSYRWALNGAIMSRTDSTIPNSLDIDGYGNILYQVKQTYDYTTTKSYWQKIRKSYVYPNSSTGVHGLVASMQVTNEVPDERDGFNGSQIETTEVAYSYYPGTARLWVEEIEPNAPSNSSLRLRKTFEYDSIYGYQSKVTHSGYGMADRSAKTQLNFSHASSSGRGPVYQEVTTNAKGHVSKVEVDVRTGKAINIFGPNNISGPNGYTTEWYYDNLGRKIREELAEGVTTKWGYLDCKLDSACNTAGTKNEIYYVVKQRDGQPLSKVFYDKLGRKVRTETGGFNNTVIETRTAYDSFGRAKGSTNNYFKNLTTAQWTCVEHDVLNRPVRQTIPSGTNCSNSSVVPTLRKIAYNGYRVTETVFNGTAQVVKQQRKNALDQLVQVVDEINNSAFYYYNAQGKVTEVKDPNGNYVKTAYDKRGRKISMDDPDLGYLEYQYNSVGEIIWQKDAKNQIVKTAYDVMGRKISRIAPGESSTWTYDNCYRGIGKVCSTQSTNGYSQTIRYDYFSRPMTTTSTILSTTYRVDRTYDSAGRVKKTSYPYAYGSRFETQNCYDNNGFLSEVRQPGGCGSSGNIYWRANGINASGNVTSETLGNGITSSKIYDPAFGRLTAISSGKGTNLQLSTFTYDTVGNLRQRNLITRENGPQNLTEKFGYDALNRLISANIRGGFGTINKTYAYDAIGNIVSKSDFGNEYRYESAKPHAVTSVWGASGRVANYQYDANGFMVKNNGILIDPTWFRKTASITKNSETTFFGYDTSQMRTWMQHGNDRTVYLNPRIDKGGHYEKEIKNGRETHKHYIYGASGVIGVYEKTRNTNQYKYFLTDHLGSIEVVADGATGRELERLSYDAFGKRRIAAGNDAISQIIASQTHHGFTGHEHLDHLGLINMNGRIYDPNLGRFMSADPTVRYVTSTQGFNRYSYTDNNPLSRVDLNGYSWLSDKWKSAKKSISRAWKKYKTTIITVAFSMAGMPWVGALINAGIAAHYGASLGDIASGIVIGMVAGAIAGPIAGSLSRGLGMAAGSLGTALIRGTLSGGFAGGISSKLNGGSFREGFIQGARSGAVTAGLVWGYRAYQTEQFIKNNLSCGGNPCTKAVLSAVRDAGQSPIGQKMMSHYRGTSNTLFVLPESSSPYIKVTGPHALTGTNIMWFDGNVQSSIGGLISSEPWGATMDDATTFLHEAAHADPSWAVRDPLEFWQSTGKPDSVSVTENPYRNWMGAPLRTDYALIHQGALPRPVYGYY